MTYVTLKWGQGHPVQILPLSSTGVSMYQIWWEYIKYFFRYWVETIFHRLLPSMTSVTLKIEVKVTRFELGLRLVLVLKCTKLVKIRQIFFWILSRNHLAYAHPPLQVQCDHILRRIFQTGLSKCTIVYKFITKIWVTHDTLLVCVIILGRYKCFFSPISNFTSIYLVGCSKWG